MFQFEKIVDSVTDLAGRIRVTVSLIDGKKREWAMLKYAKEPAPELVADDAARLCVLKNTPIVPEKSIEDYKTELVQKEAIIAAKEAEISSLKAVKEAVK